MNLIRSIQYQIPGLPLMFAVILLATGPSSRGQQVSNNSAPPSMLQLVTTQTVVSSMVIRADHDPVAPGDFVTYTIEFVHGGPFFDGTRTLQVPIPGLVRFVSATDGGLLVGNAVEWYLEGASSEEYGKREFTVQVNETAAVGGSFSLQVRVPGDPAESWSYTGHIVQTRIQPPFPLQVAIQGTPMVDDLFQDLGWTVTVRNVSDHEVLNISVVSLLDRDWWDIDQSRATGDGGLARLRNGSEGLQGSWFIGKLAAGESVAVSLLTRWWVPMHVSDFFSDTLIQHKTSVTYLGGTVPGRHSSVLRVYGIDPVFHALRIDKIDLTADPSNPSGKLATFHGAYFSDQLRAVFRSGHTRIEVPVGEVRYVDDRVTTVPVVLPSEFTNWTAYLIGGNESAHLAFRTEVKLALAKPALTPSSGTFSCLLEGGRDQPVSIQFSTDLTLWRDLINFVPNLDSVLVTDPDSSKQETRFYRALIRD